VTQQPDSALVVAAMGGDAGSFTELCRRYYPAMVAIAHAVLGDGHLAEDAAQHAFATAARRLPQLKRQDRFAHWLAAICRNRARDMARARKDLRPADDLSMIAAESHEDGLTDAVRDAIAELSAAARELVYLRYYDGMSYEQIASVLGISEQAINGRLRRAKKKIAGHLRRNGFAETRHER